MSILGSMLLPLISSAKEEPKEPKELPKNIIKSSSMTISVSQILQSYDPDMMERARTDYRKPSYQRIRTQSEMWCEQLIESMINGRTLGSLIMSEWNKFVDGRIDQWKNIEDGQTRLDAMKRFKEKQFSTKYGSYDDENIRDIFNSYQLPVILQQKTSSDISDEEYFKELNENFSVLQEGKSLEAHDRYWTWNKDKEYNFEGSPLINYILELIQNPKFTQKFKDCMRLVALNNRDKKSRKDITHAVSLVSGAIWGSSYSNGSYYKHISKLQCEIEGEEKERCEKLLSHVFRAIEEVFKIKKIDHNEQIKTLFLHQKTFTAAMLEDFRDVIDNNVEVQNKINKWVYVINEYRTDRNFLKNR